MKPHTLLLPLLVALAAVVGGASSARADGTCSQRTNAYFYTTDAQDLSRGLAANAASCADYWISIAPYTDPSSPNLGKPKGAPALPVVHAQGAQFHGLAEIRMKNWCTYAATSGWYATGQMLHDWMLREGYDPARDTWAVNEVGTPSTAPCQSDVFDGAPGAREGFAEFVRGLYDGLPGEAPMAGVVFGADPMQVTPDLASYERGLAAWYADSPFWEAMNKYVAVWAQETYADARAWGVDGASLADRTAALNAYFLHGSKLAANDAAASSFFAHAYTPLGNASYISTAVAPPGPGFGYTDIGFPLLIENFVSAQVYALRTAMGNRFGFAVVPVNTGGPAIRQGVEAHLGAAIRDSQDDPLGACTSAGESCDGVVAGASLPTTWPGFATPPIVVPHVDGPQSNGWYTGDVTISWDVSDPQTGVDSSSGCDPVRLTEDTASTTYTCSATSSGGSTIRSVTVKRDATPPTVECAATPSTLWPPNGKLVPATVAVDVTDATSGPAGFVLSAAPAEDASGWDVGTPDTAGLLRAQRTGSGGDRVYTLTYTARDAAGNAATCDVAVTVPHDQGT